MTPQVGSDSQIKSQKYMSKISKVKWLETSKWIVIPMYILHVTYLHLFKNDV